LSKIQYIELLSKLLEATFALTSQVFNASTIATKLQMNRITAIDYLSLLEYQFLIDRIPEWSTNRIKRLIKTPKIYAGDTGFACALLHQNRSSLLKNRTLYGPFVETFVFQELRRQASASEDYYSFFHFRVVMVLKLI